MGNTKVVTVCGSSDSMDIMAVCAWVLEHDERCIVHCSHLLPCWCMDGVGCDVVENMDLCFEKIRSSDEVFIVDLPGTLDDNLQRMVGFARENNIKVRLYSGDIVGRKTDDKISFHGDDRVNKEMDCWWEIV